jgi:succinate-acetate transporter protein
MFITAFLWLFLYFKPVIDRQINVFGATAFTAYGFFWWSLIIIWINPFEGIAAADDMSMAKLFFRFKSIK